MNESFGRNVKTYRKKLGLTQEELAKAVGYNGRQSICIIEKGKSDVSTEMASKIANALGVPVKELLALSPEEEKENDVFRYLPYLLKADEATLTVIRRILGMPSIQEEKK